jgi:hypothetical protein
MNATTSPAIRTAYTDILNLAITILKNNDGQRISEYLSEAADGLVDVMRGDARGLARAARFMGLAEGLCEQRADDVLESSFTQYTRYIEYARILRNAAHDII